MSLRPHSLCGIELAVVVLLIYSPLDRCAGHVAAWCAVDCDQVHGYEEEEASGAVCGASVAEGRSDHLSQASGAEELVGGIECYYASEKSYDWRGGRVGRSER